MNCLAKGSPDQLTQDYKGYELYLEEKDIFENFEETLNKIEKFNIKSIHTPHVTYEDYQETIRLCDELAQELNASIVIHSSYVRPLMANKEFNYNILESEYGIENHWGFSIPQIKRTIFDHNNHKLTLDVAHLYVTNPGLYQRNLSHILFEYPEQISQIHFCDATKQKDGLPIGLGNINMKRTLRKILKSEYDGDIVVEVPVKEREKSIQRTKELFKNIKKN